MIYCISDIHGDYAKFLKLLQKINFDDADVLYVLGDVCDRGSEPMQVLLKMMAHDNIIPLCGNHDFMAMRCLRLLSKELTESFLETMDEERIQFLSVWFENGGKSTMDNFRQLSQAQRIEVLDYLGEFELYAELQIHGQDYLLVHAGLGEFSKEKLLEDYTLDQLIDVRLDYTQEYFADKILVTGHTPTQLIANHPNPGYIYQANHHIAIDCGCGFGGRLAAICLDTGEEFYVE